MRAVQPGFPQVRAVRSELLREQAVRQAQEPQPGLAQVLRRERVQPLAARREQARVRVARQERPQGRALEQGRVRALARQPVRAVRLRVQEPVQAVLVPVQAVLVPAQAQLQGPEPLREQALELALELAQVPALEPVLAQVRVRGLGPARVPGQVLARPRARAPLRQERPAGRRYIPRWW
ncbi:hypothetical protein N8D56_12095 [Devosia sp. A8/3-2]|nr:hypothetical protein N8D56_12095 [Devosia sp. A8/3-2]